MTQDPDRQTMELLDAYLDGFLDAAEREAFEGEARKRPELEQEIEIQREIDESLRRIMAVPAQERFAAVVEAARAARADAREPRRWRITRSVLAAAAVVLIAVGAWMSWTVLAPSAPPEGPYRSAGPWRDMGTVFADTVAEGFVPDWVCEGEVFVATFRDQFRQPLQIGELPEGVEALGLSYANTLSPWSMCLLARVDGEPVIVFVDRIESERDPPLPDGSTLSWHRSEVGKLVLYELSRFDTPRVMQWLYEPAGDEPGR